LFTGRLKSRQIINNQEETMDLGLKGKVALVTGAGSQIGYGKGIALTLAKEGCDIIANDVDLEGAKQTAAEVEALGCKAMAIKADVTSRTEVDDMIKAALAKFGKIDILLNNAGAANPPKPFVETTQADWDREIDINLKGILNCTKAVLDQMISRKSGKIISIASTVAKTGGAIMAVYGAAKGGVSVFTKGLAAEVAALGINVNCVAPGPGNTGFTRLAPPGFLEKIAETIPVKKFTTPQDIGNAVAFLASDAASDIVGQTLSVDGGMTMY
jgi:NAD(P)-dependent dehydrogenase (short-subunit alcohol dehydrogenase family)